MNSLETISIIGGCGAMGHFMEERMLDGSQVMIYDPAAQAKLSTAPSEQDRLPRTNFVNFDEALQADAVILAVPAPALAEVVSDVAVHLKTNKTSPLIVDICSVKEYPAALFDEHLGDCDERLLCHPLFGPRSAKDGLAGHKVIVTGQHGDKAAELLRRWQQLDLDVVEMSAAHHDEAMATVQILPFALGMMATAHQNSHIASWIESRNLTTPSLEATWELARLRQGDSEALLDTILGYNRFADEVLAGIVRSADLIQTRRAAQLAAQAGQQSATI